MILLSLSGWALARSVSQKRSTAIEMARKKFRNSQRHVTSAERTYQEYSLNSPLPQTTRTELVRLIRGGEDTYLELKLKLSNSEKIVQEIIALANTAGGTIIFGVTDKLLIQGLRYPERVQDELVRICKNEIVPPVVPLLDSVAFDNGRIIVALEIRGNNRPYRTRGGKFFIRSGPEKREASREELSQLISESRPLFYENIPLKGYPANGFDDAVLWSFIRAYSTTPDGDSEYDTAKVLKKDLLLAVGGRNEFLPTVAGVLLFGEDEHIESAISNSGIHLRRYSGDADDPDLVEELYITGNLLSLFDLSAEFMERYCDLVKHRQRKEKPEVAAENKSPVFHLYAIREALANMIMHRDLAMRDIHTEINVFDDSIEFTNPRRTLGFVPPASKAIRYGITQRVNPQIASVFCRREYGAMVPNGGLPMVLKQAELLAGRKPELSTNNDKFRLLLFSG